MFRTFTLGASHNHDDEAAPSMIGCIVGAFFGVAACQPVVLRCNGQDKFAGMTLPADELITLNPASDTADTPFGKMEFSASETEFVLKANPVPKSGVGNPPRLPRGSETVKSSTLLCRISRVKEDMWCEAKITYDDGGELYRLPSGWNYLGTDRKETVYNHDYDTEQWSSQKQGKLEVTGGVFSDRKCEIASRKF